MSLVRGQSPQGMGAEWYNALRAAALDQSPIDGLTHRFYRYPARFSPVFARTAILQFSNPGDLVLDPFMGGGTTLLEAVNANRQGVGADLNELAVFIARAKTTPLTRVETSAVSDWADDVIPRLTYNATSSLLAEATYDRRAFNLSA